MENRQRQIAHMLELGRLGFGGAPVGNLYTEIEDEAAIAAVREAHRAGVRYFDTAPHYGNGLAEHRLGAALRGVARESFVLWAAFWRLTHAHRAIRTVTSASCPSANASITPTKGRCVRSTIACSA